MMLRVALVAIVIAACGESARPTTVEIAPVPSASVVEPSVDAAIESSAPKSVTAHGNALIARTCGPTDGPATTLIISNEILTCDDWQRDRKHAYVSIETWGTLALTERTSIDLPGNQGGEVTTCTAGGVCDRVKRASLTIDHVSSDGFDGALDVTPKTGANRHIAIHAIRCELHIMCG